MGSTEQVLRTAQLFSQAVVDPAGWPCALEALARATRSGHGEILFLDRATARPLAWWLTGADGIDLDAFRAAGGYDPDANVRIAAIGRPMELIHETHYDAVQPRLARGAAVADMFHAAAIESGCQTTLAADAETLIAVAVLRGGRDGRTDMADRAAFAAIAPYVRDAALATLGLERQGAQLLAGALEAMSVAAFLLDRWGRLVAQTRAADALLREGRLRLIGGRLAGARGDAALLGRAIADRLVPDPASPPPPLAIVPLAGDGRGPLIADVSALPSRDWNYGGAPAVLVTIRSGALRREGAADLVRQAWDLSRAEAEIVVALAAGRPRGAIAAARRVSPETVRAQLKSIFAKVGVTREAELATRAAALIGTV